MLFINLKTSLSSASHCDLALVNEISVALATKIHVC